VKHGVKEESKKKIRRKRGLSPLPHPLVVVFFVLTYLCTVPNDLNPWNKQCWFPNETRVISVGRFSDYCCQYYNNRDECVFNAFLLASFMVKANDRNFLFFIVYLA